MLVASSFGNGSMRSAKERKKLFIVFFITLLALLTDLPKQPKRQLSPHLLKIADLLH